MVYPANKAKASPRAASSAGRTHGLARRRTHRSAGRPREVGAWRKAFVPTLMTAFMARIKSAVTPHSAWRWHRSPITWRELTVTLPGVELPRVALTGVTLSRVKLPWLKLSWLGTTRRPVRGGAAPAAAYARTRA